MKKKYKVLVKDTFVFAVGKLGSRLILFFLVPLYTNVLSKAEYGTADLVFTVSQLLMPLFSMAIFESIVRFGLSKTEKKENVILNAYLVLLICAAITIIMTPLFGLYSGISAWKWYLAFLIIISAIMDTEMNYLKVIGRNMAFSVISILQAFVLAVSNIVFLVFLSYGIKGYLLSTIISYSFCTIVAFAAGHILADLKQAKIDKDLLKRMLVYSSPLILNSVSWWVIQSSDKLMLECMVGAAALGLFTAASKVPSLINVVITVFQQAWGISSIKEIETTNDSSFYSNVFKVYSTGVFFCCIVLITITKPFMSIYVGSDFREAWQYAPLLIASAGFSAISAYYGSMYSALKKSVNNMLTTLFTAVVNLIVNYLFIGLFGIWGAIIGTIVAYVLISYVRMIDVSKYVEIKICWHGIIINSIIVITQAIVVSLNFYIYSISLFLVMLFIVVNKSTLFSLFADMKNKILKDKG